MRSCSFVWKLGVSRDPQRVRRLLRSYARFQGASVPYTSIQADLATNETDSFSADLVSAYALALRQIFVIEDVPAWNPNLRSSTAIRTSEKLGDGAAIDQGAHSLKTLRGKLDTGKMQPPSFLMVLIGVGDYAYHREDGVLVVPIGTLCP